MNSYLSVLSAIAICIFLASALPQIHTLIKSKQARDISRWMALLITLGNLLMLIRAVCVRDLYFSLNYAFQLALWLTMDVLIWAYRQRG